MSQILEILAISSARFSGSSVAAFSLRAWWVAVAVALVPFAVAVVVALAFFSAVVAASLACLSVVAVAFDVRSHV